MDKVFTISNLLDIYSRIYQQCDKDNISVIESEMRKIVPSATSEVTLMVGANYTDKKIGIDWFISNPLPESQTQHMTFVDILTQCILKADISKLKIMCECADFIDNSAGNSYFVNATEVSYNEELDRYSIYVFIYKKTKRKKK